tara:strand:+ start:628 stop:1566 length:939 start_codon:yes stop_codon:yes gene_type:complete
MDKRNYLELHFYLENHDHTLNAKLFNLAEAEFIKIVEEVAKILKIEVKTNVLPRKEGGLETFYEFVTAPENESIRNIAVYFGGLISKILADVVANNIKTDTETEKLKKQKLELEIEKLKKELEEIDLKKEHSPEVINLKDRLALYAAETNKVKVSKSNFYRFLNSEDKIIRFATRQVNADLEPLEKENVVPKKDFSKFIINEADIEPDFKNNVEIEIVSPVLKRSRANWRGIYNDKAFNFKMKDKRFQQMVIQKNLNFSSGTLLICDLELKQKLDSEGEVKIKGHEVYNVIQIVYPDGEVIDIIYDENEAPF